MPGQSHRPTTKIDDVPTDPEGCNSEAKSVEGVERQDSIRSSIGPPASSSKRSNQKGMGKKPPKTKNGSDDVPTDPEDCNSEAKSVEGVDGKDSVRSSIHPPASSPKRSNQKGRGS